MFRCAFVHGNQKSEHAVKHGVISAINHARGTTTLIEKQTRITKCLASAFHSILDEFLFVKRLFAHAAIPSFFTVRKNGEADSRINSLSVAGMMESTCPASKPTSHAVSKAIFKVLFSRVGRITSKSTSDIGEASLRACEPNKITRTG